MPTRKTVFWLLAAASLYLIAWNVGSGWLYILTALVAAAPAASLILGLNSSGGISISLRVPAAARQGESLIARVALENGSRLPRFFLGLDCALAGAKAGAFIPVVKGRRQLEADVRFDGLRRGVYGAGGFSLSSGAPFGMSRSSRRMSAGCELVVYPHWERLRRDWETGRRNAGYMVESALPTRNTASDYLGVREYRPGDCPRSIHWRTSARAGGLAIIEYARRTAMTPVFIIDTFEQAALGAGATNTFETAVSMAASMIQREAAKNRRFGYGSSPGDASSNGLGLRPGPAMLWLAAIRPRSENPLDLSAPLKWADATPVLLLASHAVYARIFESPLLLGFPHSLVIMLDGRGFGPDRKNRRRLMDDSSLDNLARGIESRGGTFITVPSAKDASQCLESL